jgi:glucarate dehydratase
MSEDVKIAVLRGREMRIGKIECIPVTIPIEAPILTSYGSLKSYARTIIRVHTEDGRVGYGDTSARVLPEAVSVFAPMLRGLSVWDLKRIERRLRNWNYYPWQKTEPVIAAIEMACLDIQGKALDLPLSHLLGGRFHEEVPVAGYVFYRHANESGEGQVHTVDEVVAFAETIVEKHGFRALKLKGGYFSPEHDLNVLGALRERFGRDMALRIDPQGSWSPTAAVRIGRELEKLGLEYYEDPVWGAANMARVRRDVRIPFATNMCVTTFDELLPAFQTGSVDIILSDLWYWGGIRPCMELERICSTMGLGIGMHSGTELSIGWAAMLQTSSAMSTLRLGIDYMNMHLIDDLAIEGRFMPVDGVVRPPDAPGLGITIDADKLDLYSKIAKSGDADDRFLNPTIADQARPGWYPEMPAW